MHIRVILPVIGESLLEPVRGEVAGWAAPGTTVDVVSLERDTASIESEYDEALAAPGILQRVEQAARDGVDGVFEPATLTGQAVHHRAPHRHDPGHRPARARPGGPRSAAGTGPGQASDAVASGEADVGVLGCTGMLGVAAQLRERLAAKGLGVPVIDPTGSRRHLARKLRAPRPDPESHHLHAAAGQRPLGITGTAVNRSRHRPPPGGA